MGITKSHFFNEINHIGDDEIQKFQETGEQQWKSNTVPKKAPEGMFRVIAVDTFDGNDWIEGDYETEVKACVVANNKCGEMLKTHVYDDKGTHLYEAGNF